MKDDPLGSIVRKHYLIRHWRGELSLSHSFWLNCVLLNLLITGAFTASAKLLANAPSVWNAASALIYWPLATVILVWQVVGVLASARRSSMSSKGSASAWLARIAVCAMAVLGILNIYRRGIPNLEDANVVLHDDAKYGESTVSALPWGTAIEIKGWIAPSSADRFASTLEASPKVTTVYLNTIGGRIAEARSIADLVRLRKLNIYVSRVCVSAGVIILVAGNERVARENSLIGLHGAFMPGASLSNEQLETINLPEAEALRQAGADETFVQTVIRVAIYNNKPQIGGGKV